METSTVKIGEYLKKFREKQNVPIKLISRHTKISIEMLEYLESSQLAKLPNKAYVIGYVKSYAKTLKLDVATTLGLLEESYRIDSNDPILLSQKTVSDESDAESNRQKNTKISYQTIGTICVFLLPLCYVIYLQNKAPLKDQQGKEKTGLSLGKAPIESQILSSTTPLIDMKPSESGLNISGPVPKSLPNPTKKSFLPPLEDEKQEDIDKEISLKQIRHPLYSFLDDNQETSKNIPENYRKSLEQGKQSVYLLAENGDSWLTYQRDYGPVRQLFLKQGEQLFIKGNLILMFLGNVSVVKVFLNNKLLSLNSVSRVKTLVFPQEKRNEYYYPLFIYNEDGSVVNSKDYRAVLSLEN